MASDPSATLASDQVYLPKIVPNGIPVYDAMYNGTLIRMLRSLEVAYIPLAAFMSSIPFLMMGAVATHYFIYYRVL